MKKTPSEQDTRERQQGGATSLRIVIPEPHSMVSLLGSRDELLRLIEEALASDIHVRGNEITISGEAPDNSLARRPVEELRDRRSLAYTVSAGVVEHRRAGVFRTFMAVSPARAGEARGSPSASPPRRRTRRARRRARRRRPARRDRRRRRSRHDRAETLIGLSSSA